MDTYTITVTFFRSFSADSEVVSAGTGKVPTDSELIQQMRKELQMAYDDPDIAIDGRFEISAIDTKNCRKPTCA